MAELSRIATSIDRLLQSWSQEQVEPEDGITHDRIAQFEERNNIRLSADFRFYLARVNGMKPRALHDTDSRGFYFWPTNKIKSVADYYATHGTAKIEALKPEWSSYFVFADYLQRSWAYAIRLTTDIGVQGDVLRVDGTSQLRRVSRTFVDFIDLYLADSELLYKGLEID